MVFWFYKTVNLILLAQLYKYKGTINTVTKGRYILFQFLWCCQQEIGDRCLLPRAGEPITLESAFKDAFQQPVLTIPPSVLPVGRYVVFIEFVTLRLLSSSKSISVARHHINSRLISLKFRIKNQKKNTWPPLKALFSSLHL